MAQQINLFSPLFLQKRKHFSASTMLQLLGIILLGIVLFYGYAAFEVRKLQQIAAESTAQLRSQSDAVAKLTAEFSPQGRSRLLEDETARLGVRLKQREQTIALLRTGGLGNTEGFGRYLTALARQTTPGVWITGVSLAGDEAQLQLNGKAVHPDLIPAYLRTLSKEEVMRGRRVAELRLTSREETPPAQTAVPGAQATPAKPAATPTRYVEFSISAVRSAPSPTDAGEKR